MRLTVGQYQALYEVGKSDRDTTEKAIENVAIITGKTLSQVEDMPMADFVKAAREVNDMLANFQPMKKPVSFLRCNGKIYQINFKPATLTAGQYTALEFWLSEPDWIKNTDKILACLAVRVNKRAWWYLPAKKQPDELEKAADLQSADMAEAHGCVVFFCKVFATSVQAFRPYLEKQLKKKGKTKEEIQQAIAALTKSLDGYTTLSV